MRVGAFLVLVSIPNDTYESFRDVYFASLSGGGRVSISVLEGDFPLHLLPMHGDIYTVCYKRLDRGFDHGLTTNSHYFGSWRLPTSIFEILKRLGGV